MSITWDRFHSDCRQLSNVSVICEDGVIFTHKLVLANISILMKNTLKEIPTADEATIYLKDFSKEDVELFMLEASLGKESKNADLRLLFGDISVSPAQAQATSDEFFKSLAKSEVRIKDEDEDVWDNEEHLSSDTFLNDSELPSDLNIEVADKNTEKVTQEVKKELIENPRSNSQKMSNKQIDKKIRYEKALAAYKSGRVETYKQAAELFGVNHAVLRKYNAEGYSYMGQGREGKRFTREEEMHIKQRVLEITDGGNNFTLAILKKVILEEAEIIKVNQPERFFLGFPTKQILNNYCATFRRSHGFPGFGNNTNTQRGEKKELVEKKKMDPDELEEFDRKTQEQIKEYEKDLIENPQTEKQKAVNKKIDKKIRYEKAMASFKTGRVQSCRQAAIMYGVNDSVLGKLISEGTSFRGKGFTLKRFTAEEEKLIVDRIWKLSEGGRVLTNKMVQTIILEEAEIVKVNQPERTELMTFATSQKLASFTLGFTRRHDMDQICDAESRIDREQRRIHECEICYHTFTYQNTLVAHRRKCHSFLFSGS